MNDFLGKTLMLEIPDSVYKGKDQEFYKQIRGTVVAILSNCVADENKYCKEIITKNIRLRYGLLLETIVYEMVVQNITFDEAYKMYDGDISNIISFFQNILEKVEKNTTGERVANYLEYFMFWEEASDFNEINPKVEDLRREFNNVIISIGLVDIASKISKREDVKVSLKENVADLVNKNIREKILEKEEFLEGKTIISVEELDKAIHEIVPIQTVISIVLYETIKRGYTLKDTVKIIGEKMIFEEALKDTLNFKDVSGMNYIFEKELEEICSLH